MAMPQYREKEWLQEQYLEREKSYQEIADECGVSLSTIQYWINEHDIKPRDRRETGLKRYGNEGKKYLDYDWLREEYYENDKAATVIADECGVSYTTIYRHMDNAGIDRRERGEATNISDNMGPEYGRQHHNWKEYCHFATDTRGYERALSTNKVVKIHRLLAVAEYGIEAVKDKDVHHKNNIPWDNRPENIGLMEHAEHSSMHNLEWKPKRT